MKMDRFFNSRATPFQACNRIEKENQMTTYNHAKVNSHKMFYREGGDERTPTIVPLPSLSQGDDAIRILAIFFGTKLAAGSLFIPMFCRTVRSTCRHQRFQPPTKEWNCPPTPIVSGLPERPPTHVCQNLNLRLLTSNNERSDMLPPRALPAAYFDRDKIPVISRTGQQLRLARKNRCSRPR